MLISTCTVSLIGAAIAPGSSSIYRVIVAQILVGFGFAAVPLAYAIPSEVSHRGTSRDRRLLTRTRRSCPENGDRVRRRATLTSFQHLADSVTPPQWCKLG